MCCSVQQPDASPPASRTLCNSRTQTCCANRYSCTQRTHALLRHAPLPCVQPCDQCRLLHGCGSEENFQFTYTRTRYTAFLGHVCKTARRARERRLQASARARLASRNNVQPGGAIMSTGGAWGLCCVVGLVFANKHHGYSGSFMRNVGRLPL